MTYLFAVIGLALLILAHEFGHFLIAKLFGVKVNEFMIGLPGPKLFSYQGKETTYGITLIPFGGYVRLHGEFEDPENPEKTKDEKSFISKPATVRILVLASGAIFNVLLAVLLFSAVFLYGIPNYPTTIIDKVYPDTAAQKAGFQEGDKILKIDNRDIGEWQDLVEYVSERPGKKVTITLKRNDDKLKLHPTIGRKDNKGYLGIKAKTTTLKMGLFDSIIKATNMTYQMTKTFVEFIYKELFKGDLLKQSAGPIGIVVETSRAVKVGFDFYFYLLGLISINLAIVNLFPVPPLDGGRILISLVEKALGRKIPFKVLAVIQLAGILLFLFLMIYLIQADLQRYHLLGAGR